MDEKVILITGCSSGIGFDAGFALKKCGYRVIASCRKNEDVQKLINSGLEAVRLDVSDAVIKKIIHAIEAKNPKPKYVITFPAHLMIFLKRILSNRMLHRVLYSVSKKELS
jgi:NAD(P)-dependent dehydrogenase (short-subunit alcohol dehydrogenase family)